MKIYIDNDFKCHTGNDGTMREVETDYFNGKCAYYIEGFRFVPQGEDWIQPNGMIITGEMIAAWKDYHILECAQEAASIVQAEADEQIMSLLDTIEELIIGG